MQNAPYGAAQQRVPADRFAREIAGFVSDPVQRARGG